MPIHFKCSPWWTTKRLPLLNQCPFSSNYRLVEKRNARHFLISAYFFKRSPCWKTRRPPFFTSVLFLNFSPFWKTQYLPFFSSVYFLRTLIFLNGNTLAVFPVSIFFKFSPSWKTRRLPFVVPAFFFFNYSPCWKTKRLPPFCTSVNSLQIFIVLEQIKTRHF